MPKKGTKKQPSTMSTSVEELMRMLVEERAQRETEFTRREREVQTQMATMQQHMESLLRVVSDTTARPSSVNRPADVKLVPLTEKDDIEAYLVTFERIMAAHEITMNQWPYHLAPQLTGRAQLAFAALSSTEARDYDAIKAAILARYDINEEAYRRRFRSAMKRRDETFRELSIRLVDLRNKWMRSCSSMEDVAEVICLEQFYETLSVDMRTWVRDKKPRTCKQAGELADEYVQTRQIGSNVIIRAHNKPSTNQKRCFSCNQIGHFAKNCPAADKKDDSCNDDKKERQGAELVPQAKATNTGVTGKTKGEQNVKCYNCGQRGHISTKCPSSAMFCKLEQQSPVCQSGSKTTSVCRSGQVEGIHVDQIVLDTGCSRTMVRQDLVPRNKLIEGDAVTIRCAHGDTVLYPVAQLELLVDGVPVCVEAAVSKSLPVQVLLGTDVPELHQLLGDSIMSRQVENSMMVVTHTQAMRQVQEDATTRSKECESGANPHRLVKVPEELTCIGREFDDEIFSTSQEKAHKTKRQKRELRKQHYEASKQDSISDPLGISAAKLKELQLNDITLSKVRQTANSDVVSSTDKPYYWQDGLLYHQWRPHGDETDIVVNQLVLPQQCREKVLSLAHSIPLAGHLGKEKTRKRIMQHFYWPTIYKDVEHFCRCCRQCQKSSNKGVPKAPLVPLPIISTPFEKIAMDIVGPLPRSRSGHRYILVICDYSTRYPEAIPLRNIDAEHIAEELIKVFARVGIPEEILTDQGSNFTSKLLSELYRLLKIQAVRTSPYHPQSDGLVERFNQTLKMMLRKFVTKEGKDWDKLLPYVLFAYREVPQASTGFSPFELIYGWKVRGPMAVLREAWESGKSQDASVVAHVVQIREQLQQMTDLVEQNMEKAQANQKKWYDRNARSRKFEPGDQVLVLLPTSTSKLLAQWQGPYEVVKPIGEVDYMINMHDRRNKRRVFHVNMLKQFHCSTDENSSFLVSDTGESSAENEVPDDEIPSWNSNQNGYPKIGDQLSVSQRCELQKLLDEFTDVLKDKPGRTTIVEHTINTGMANPVRLPPYRVPHAYREMVESELKEMLDNGIIEPSASQWSASMVLVKKKDGSLRICVDYRRLNSVSQVDAYPMPRVDELLDRLGKANFISTMDLTRGYWQVPVAERDRHKVMPFGLQGAPATFQRMMDRLLTGAYDFAAAYLDDLVIYSSTWSDHLHHIRSMLHRLREAGLTVKLRKCQFGMQQCVYLGFVVGSGLLKPEVDKLQAIKQLPIPKTKRDVRAFLGITGYYRKFIADYATVAAPLTDLTKKNSPNQVVWTERCAQAWKTLKVVLCSSPILRSPDFTSQFILQTDASDHGVGAVLSQRDEHGADHPVAYYSKKLLAREVRYSTVEKECLAIRLATHSFRVYLLGRPFIIQTDHRALQWLDRLKDSNPRLARWSLALQPYQFTVEHRAGLLNGNADALSRAAAN